MKLTCSLAERFACAFAMLTKNMQDHKRGLRLAWVVCLGFWPAAMANGLAAEATPPLVVTIIDDTDVSAIWRSGSGWQDFSGLGKTHYNGTAMSSQQAGDLFAYGNSACTRIRWFATKSMDRGMADVYVDGVLKQTVDTYAPQLQHSQAVFDTGVLPLGPHQIKVVVKAARNAAATASWLECDTIEVTHDIADPRIPFRKIRASCRRTTGGSCTSESGKTAGCRPRNSDPTGLTTRALWYSRGQPCGGWAARRRTMDWPTSISISNSCKRSTRTPPVAATAQVLFEKTGLSAGQMHTFRVEVRREKRRRTGNVQQVHGFEVAEVVNYPEFIRRAAEVELKAIAAGTKPYLAPETWKPVAYAAAAPVKGVTLEAGPLRDCFGWNVAYLNRCFAAPHGTYCDSSKVEGFWLVDLPGSSEGRMLGGAGHTLRWGERADMARLSIRSSTR